MDKGAGFVYFIQAKSGPIKIGHSDDPKKRFDNFVVGHYEELALLGVMGGTRDDEKRIQDQLRGSHIRGEWFYPTAEVIALARQAVAVVPPKKRPMLASSLPSDRHLIEEAIEKAGDITRAAVHLGCSRRTLQNRMRALGMPVGHAGRKVKRLASE